VDTITISFVRFVSIFIFFAIGYVCWSHSAFQSALNSSIVSYSFISLDRTVKSCRQSPPLHQMLQRLVINVVSYLPIFDVASWQHLRSGRRHYLVVLRHSLSSYGRRALAVAGPTAWNSLSDDLRDPTLSTDSFMCLLKIRLFSEYIQRIKGIALYAP